MHQTVYSLDPTLPPLVLPAPDAEVLSGVRWGHCSTPFSVAYWRAQLYMQPGNYANYALGATLFEECAACLLGGYGIPAEMGLVAYHRIKELGLLRDFARSEAEYAEALLEPLELAGKKVLYRFARQKARYLALAASRFAEEQHPVEPLAIRNWLLTIPGIGPKTASWIVRNYCRSDDVAILDIHILRAGQLIGLFRSNADVAKAYFELETRYLTLCKSMEVSAAELDACIWFQMKQNSEFARRKLVDMQSGITTLKHESRQPQKRGSRVAAHSTQGVLPLFPVAPVAC